MSTVPSSWARGEWYAFGATWCPGCQDPRTKALYASLRESMGNKFRYFDLDAPGVEDFASRLGVTEIPVIVMLHPKVSRLNRYGVNPTQDSTASVMDAWKRFVAKYAVVSASPSPPVQDAPANCATPKPVQAQANCGVPSFSAPPPVAANCGAPSFSAPNCAAPRSYSAPAYSVPRPYSVPTYRNTMPNLPAYTGQYGIAGGYNEAVHHVQEHGINPSGLSHSQLLHVHELAHTHGASAANQMAAYYRSNMGGRQSPVLRRHYSAARPVYFTPFYSAPRVHSSPPTSYRIVGSSPGILRRASNYVFGRPPSFQYSRPGW